jgi:hypothetical protein
MNRPVQSIESVKVCICWIVRVLPSPFLDITSEVDNSVTGVQRSNAGFKANA